MFNKVQTKYILAVLHKNMKMEIYIKPQLGFRGKKSLKIKNKPKYTCSFKKYEIILGQAAKSFIRIFCYCNSSNCFQITSLYCALLE